MVIKPGVYFKTFFKCRNAIHGCQIAKSTIEDMKQHEASCRLFKEIKENPNTCQLELGCSQNPTEKAIQLGYIKKSFENHNFMVFDIESSLVPTNQRRGKTTIYNVHNLLSIAVNSYVNGGHSQRVWTVESQNEQSALDMVEKFVCFCVAEASRMKIDKELQNGIQKLYDDIQCLPLNMSNKKRELNGIYYYLKKLTELSVYGYNSAKYDCPILMPYIAQAAINNEFAMPKTFDILKRSTKYISIKFGKIHFKDILLFSNPITLDRYLKTWTTDQKKYCYPYELFTSIDQVRKCTEFPPYSDFEGNIHF